jgi:trimeric autotransporter adhesin
MKTFSLSKPLFTLFLTLCFFTTLSAQTWQQVGGGMNDRVRVLLTDPAANVLYAGGKFTYAGNTFAPFIAKWDGTDWSALGSGLNGHVFAMCMYNNELYVGGSFSIAGGAACKNIAKWNGTAWSAVGSGSDSSVYSMCVYQNELYVGGIFKKAGGINTGCSAKWNGTTWSMVGDGRIKPHTNSNNNSINGVYAMEVYKNKLYIGGTYATSSNLVAIFESLLKWDGFAFTPYGNSYINTLEVFNNLLYSNASVTHDGTTLSNNFYHRVGGPSGYTYTTYSSTLFNNRLIIAGTFQIVGTDTPAVVTPLIPCNNIFSSDGTNVTDQGYGAFNNTIFASAVYNNKLYVGGDFTNVSGSQTDNIASINGLVATENIAENAYNIKVLDNPNNTGIFKIQTDIPAEIYPIRTEISDITGKIITKNKFSDNNIEIAIENKMAGFYVLMLFDKNNQKIGTQKLVISK